MKDKTRLKWNGSIDAQQQADEAFSKLKPKKKKKRKCRRQSRSKFVDYSKYLKSKHWLARRQIAITRAGGRCERCLSTICLNVHHKSYDNLFKEKDDDLEVLCDDCHKDHHLAEAFKVSADSLNEVARNLVEGY